MNKTVSVINDILVDTFNDILTIEQEALKAGSLNDLSVTEIHTIQAVGMYELKNMSEIALDLNITVGTLTMAINNLVKKKYVERIRSEEDRRVVQVRLTKKGKVAYRLHEKFHKDMVNATVEGLSSDEEKILISSLEKLNNFFKEKYNLKGSRKNDKRNV